MEEGDFVYIDYTGRIKETNEVFDSTSEEVAKREGIYNSKVRYRPIPVIIGDNFLIPGLDEELRKMKVGEKKKVLIPYEKAFGARDPNLIKLIPESEFEKRNITPKVGMMVNVSGISGRIVSISGGRVRVDFNHPLAGKNLEYEIEIKEKVEDRERKIKCIVTYFTGIEEDRIKVSLTEKEVEIETEEDIPTEVKRIIAEKIKKWIKVEKVKFSNLF